MPTAENCDSPPIVDDDLQSLDWLQNFHIMQPDFLLSLQSDDCSAAQSATATATATPLIIVKSESDCRTTTSEAIYSSKRRTKLPSSFFKHRKPLQCTFNCMIFRAIEASPHKALQLHSIYDWIADKHDYFKTAGLQWRNSVRHSLSLNKCFYRLNIDLPDESGIKTNRSSWWTVHPDFRNAYGQMVLDDGPTHRCLPRGVMTGATNFGSNVKRLSSSEHELAALANDIKAAAAILTLSQKNNNDNKKKIDDDCQVQKCIVRRHKNRVNDQFTTPKRRKKIRNGKFLLVAKNRTEDDNLLRRRRRRRKTASMDRDVDMITVETQTDEIRIPQKSLIDDAHYEASVKIEFISDDDVDQNDDAEPRQDETTTIDESNVVVARSRKNSNETKSMTDGDDDVEVCGAEFLLRLAQQKCPMDQELI